jgi:hypothetical protein
MPARPPHDGALSNRIEAPIYCAGKAAYNYSTLFGVSVRYRVEPRDVPREIAARRLGKSITEFDRALPNLAARGFPAADPDTGNFDLVAIDRWCDARHPHLFGGSATMQARDASAVVQDRIAQMKARSRGG